MKTAADQSRHDARSYFCKQKQHHSGGIDGLNDEDKLSVEFIGDNEMFGADWNSDDVRCAAATEQNNARLEEPKQQRRRSDLSIHNSSRRRLWSGSGRELLPEPRHPAGLPRGK